MVYDAKSTSSLDSPPTYEQTLALPPDIDSHEASASSSRNDVPQPPSGCDARERSVPKVLQHLFTAPPNAEPLAARDSTALQAMANIATTRKWGKTQSFDPRLQDRQSAALRLRKIPLTLLS